jgi:hypothetical protein
MSHEIYGGSNMKYMWYLQELFFLILLTKIK